MGRLAGTLGTWLALGPALGALALACSSEVGGATGSIMAGPTGALATGAMTGTAASGSTLGAGGAGAVAATGTGVGGGGAILPGTGVAGGGTVAPTDCSGPTAPAAKRLIRLTFNQQLNSLGALLGDAFAGQIQADFEIGGPTSRTFPPLGSPREGSVVTDAILDKGDRMAEAAGRYVFDNFASVTACADDACARQYLLTFAEKAYRRPLDAGEQERLLAVYSGVVAGGGTFQSGVQFGVHAVLTSPQYLYRTEFGDGGATADGLLTGSEMASQLSYFLLDAPPDQPLLDAAAAGQLATPEGILAQVDRLLATPEARENLQAAMFSYFQIPSLDLIVIDPEKAPDFNDGLRNSMYREAQLFLNHYLWNGQIEELLTSRSSFINENLADLYGVAWPPAGATPDAEGFAAATLPETRSGIMTMAGFLTARARTDIASVVGRGLLVNSTILCVQPPPFPEALVEIVEEFNATTEGQTEREKADGRAMNPQCGACHNSFDAYGLALENYDVIGKHTTIDTLGEPIDPAVTLPEAVGGATVADGVEMAGVLADSGAFATCMAKNLITYALAELAVTRDACSTKSIADAFAATDGTFTSLIREVARSQAFTNRVAGAAQ